MAFLAGLNSCHSHHQLALFVVLEVLQDCPHLIAFSLALLWTWNAPAPGLVVYCSLGNKDFFKIEVCVCAKSLQLCLSLCNPMDCSPPGSFVHGVSWARILEWVTIFFSRGSSQPKDRTCVSCLAGGYFTTEPHGKPRKTMSPPAIIPVYGALTLEKCSNHLVPGSLTLVAGRLFPGVV